MKKDGGIIAADLRHGFRDRLGKVETAAFQLPGRFWAPFLIVRSASIRPGQATPVKGAILSPSASVSAISSFNIFEEFSDGTLARRFAIRVTPEIGFPDGCPGKVCFVHLLPLHDPQQIFVPPMSTARTPS